MDTHNVDGPLTLVDDINGSQLKKDNFLKVLVPNKTEFFRDPGVWRYLKEELPKLVASKGSLKVLDLGCSSGQELLTFSILSHELGLQDKIELTGSEKFQLKLDDLLKGEFSNKEIESCEKNYGRYKIGGQFNQFFENKGDCFKVDQKYIENVKTQVFDMTIGRAFGEFDIVFCRNVMCYLNLRKSRPVYKLFSDFTVKGGLLFIGVQEDLKNSFYNKDFECLNEEYKIYKKIK